MDAKDIVSAMKGQVQSILTEGLRNYFNEARLAIEAIEKEKDIGVNECDKLWIILKSLKEVPRKMTIGLIKNSSLGNGDRAFLNIVCGDPEVYVLSPTKTTKEEIFGDGLILNDKQLVQQSFPEWPDDVNVGEED